jgi:hypothetical protein
MICTPENLVQQASCYRYIPASLQEVSKTYQLAVKAGVTLDPNQLIKDASEFITRLSPSVQSSVQIKLLCDILDAAD